MPWSPVIGSDRHSGLFCGIAKVVKSRFPNPYLPSIEELRKYHSRWNGLEDYVAQERALDWLFIDNRETCINTDVSIVLIKCSTLNDFYSTKIYKTYSVARNIISIPDFDNRLRQGDDSLVKEIAEVDGRNNYSFATKYCSHHQPTLYPIYDRYVADVLDALRRQYPAAFSFTHKEELKDYSVFRKAIDSIRKEFGLDAYSYKDIDRYLWLLGKEYFNKKTDKQH